jgi:uncharacterized membrane protein
LTVSLQLFSADRLPSTSSGVRVSIATSVGVICGVIASVLPIWQSAVLIGWDVTAIGLVTWVSVAVTKLNSEETRTHASREDPSIRMSEVIVLSRGVAMLAAVGLVLIQAGRAVGGTKAYFDRIRGAERGAFVVAHTVFHSALGPHVLLKTRRRDRLQRRRFPDLSRFCLLGLTIGMTFQVSHTNLTTKRIRRIALVHAAFSYLFGAVIVGLVINVVASLLH